MIDLLISKVEDGNVEELRRILKNNEHDFDTIDSKGNNLLHRAVLADRKKVAEYIVRKRVELTKQLNFEGLAPVHLALLSHRPGLMEMLLLATQAIDTLRTGDDLSILQYSILNTHSQTTKLLLKCLSRAHVKKIVNERNEDGQTAMHLAASSGCRETVRLLHRKGGDLFKQDSNGMLPFHHAITNGFILTAEFIAALMGHRPAEVLEMKLSRGSSCFLLTCANSFDPMTVKKLLTWKMDMMVTDKDGYDAWEYAKRNPRISTEIFIILSNYRNKD